MYLTKFDKYMSNTSQYISIPVREEYTPFSGGINPTPDAPVGRGGDEPDGGRDRHDGPARPCAGLLTGRPLRAREHRLSFRVTPTVATSLGRVAALGEALSHAFRLTLVQTVPRRFLTLSYALSRPSERQRRSTESPRQPDRFSCRHSGDPGVGKGAQDGQEKRPELRGELHLAAFPRLQRPAQAAVSCTAIKTR